LKVLIRTSNESTLKDFEYHGISSITFTKNDKIVILTKLSTQTNIYIPLTKIERITTKPEES
jgi:hypothetical protein